MILDVHDHVLADPVAYRQRAIVLPFQTVDFGHVQFHGMSLPPTPELSEWFAAAYPAFKPGLTFLRQSPEGQNEPNFIHTDVDMGDVTAILYLRPDPPPEDGTCFWRHRETGATTGGVTGGAVGHDLAAWESVGRVAAVFNRCVVFDAGFFHSRAIAANYGHGDEARLIQVLFARRKE